MNDNRRIKQETFGWYMNGIGMIRRDILVYDYDWWWKGMQWPRSFRHHPLLLRTQQRISFSKTVPGSDPNQVLEYKPAMILMCYPTLCSSKRFCNVKYTTLIIESILEVRQLHSSPLTFFEHPAPLLRRVRFWHLKMKLESFLRFAWVHLALDEIRILSGI